MALMLGVKRAVNPALRLAGDGVEAPHMVRARQRIHALGGLESSNSYVRFYLAMTGALAFGRGAAPGSRFELPLGGQAVAAVPALPGDEPGGKFPHAALYDCRDRAPALPCSPSSCAVSGKRSSSC